jgi:hypothetical protein
VKEAKQQNPADHFKVPAFASSRPYVEARLNFLLHLPPPMPNEATNGIFGIQYGLGRGLCDVDFYSGLRFTAPASIPPACSPFSTSPRGFPPLDVHDLLAKAGTSM